MAVWLVWRCIAPGRRVGRWGELGPWNIVEWKSHFLILEGLFLYFSSFFQIMLISFKKVFSVFQLQKLIRCFLTNIDVCHLALSVLAPWDIGKCKSYFLILEESAYYFSSFLRFSEFLSKTFPIFQLQELNLWLAPFWYWCLWLQMEYFGALRFSKMQITFLSFWWYHLILCHFFQILLIFWQTFNTFKL